MNIEMFLTAKEVEESLERRETATCLAWCHDNKSRLRKMKVQGASRRGGAPGRGFQLGSCRVGLRLCHLLEEPRRLHLLVQSFLVLVICWGCWVWCGLWVFWVVHPLLR